MASNGFPLVLCIRLDFNYPLAFKLTHYICNQFFNPTGTLFFHFSNGGEWITSHNTVWDGFASITRNVRFYVSCEQIHVLPLPSLQSSHQGVDIVLLMVFTPWPMLSLSIPPKQILFCILFHFARWPWLCLFKPKGLYHDWCTIDIIFSLVECYLHWQIDNFFHWWANMACLTKGIKFPIPFSFWYIYYNY